MKGKKRKGEERKIREEMESRWSPRDFSSERWEVLFAPERSTPIRNGTPTGGERGGGGGRSCGNGRGARLMAAKVKKVERRREGGMRMKRGSDAFALLGEDGK